MARLEKTVPLENGLHVRATEITVGQFRQLVTRKDLSFDMTGFLSGERDIPPELISTFTDLDPKAIPALTFSEIKQVIEAVEEVNAAFFFVTKKLVLLAGMLAGSVEPPVEAEMPPEAEPETGSTSPPSP